MAPQCKFNNFPLARGQHTFTNFAERAFDAVLERG
ncbi:MAG: hypothetical protein ACI9KK_001578 [Ascidiaceihabitans sp.]|jgi:hypothetical protein